MKTILIIDDDPFIRANLKLFLELEGYTVIEAEDGEQGRVKALAENPSLIFCDVLMQECDGFELLKRLRTDPTWVEVPFIFLTASADRDNREAGLALGANDYITKPFNLAEVLALVRQRLDDQAMGRAQ